MPEDSVFRTDAFAVKQHDPLYLSLSAQGNISLCVVTEQTVLDKNVKKPQKKKKKLSQSRKVNTSACSEEINLQTVADHLSTHTTW